MVWVNAIGLFEVFDTSLPIGVSDMDETQPKKRQKRRLILLEGFFVANLSLIEFSEFFVTSTEFDEALWSIIHHLVGPFVESEGVIILFMSVTEFEVTVQHVDFSSHEVWVSSMNRLEQLDSILHISLILNPNFSESELGVIIEWVVLELGFTFKLSPILPGIFLLLLVHDIFSLVFILVIALA